MRERQRNSFGKGFRTDLFIVREKKKKKEREETSQKRICVREKELKREAKRHFKKKIEEITRKKIYAKKDYERNRQTNEKERETKHKLSLPKPKDPRLEKKKQISYIPAKDLGLEVYAQQTKPFPNSITYDHLKENIIKDKYKIHTPPKKQQQQKQQQQQQMQC